MRLSLLVATTALLLGLLASAVRAAEEGGQYKEAEGVRIYNGLVPAAIVRGHVSGHPERSMHGGPPSGNDFHLVVAVFDATSGVRVDNAKVTARISPLGLVGPSRTLEPMQIDQTVSYGAYFPLKPGDQYTIRIAIERPGAASPATVEFSHDHRRP